MLRLNTTTVMAESLAVPMRASQKGRRVPLSVVKRAGMR
jgi:hypothetical protein